MLIKVFFLKWFFFNLLSSWNNDFDCFSRIYQERRLAAVTELVRLLKPGGQALIYVWAFEQEYNKQKSKYLKQNFKEDHGEFSSTNSVSEKSQKSTGEQISDPSCHLEKSHKPSDNMQDISPEGRLSVHTNRTAFTSQDLLVPWHLKGGKLQREENPDLSSGTDPSPGSDSDSNTSKLSPAASQASASALKPASSPVPVFHRYYHVFQQGELEQLCAQVSGVQVKSSYHDQGNWCVVLQKEWMGEDVSVQIKMLLNKNEEKRVLFKF